MRNSNHSIEIEDEDDPYLLSFESLPRYEKWQRPEKCSAKESVRKGLCRSMRHASSISHAAGTSFKKSLLRKAA